MFIPLPQHLEDKLVELSECQSVVDAEMYNEEETSHLSQLSELGLVVKTWRVTPSGKKYLEALKEKR